MYNDVFVFKKETGNYYARKEKRRNEKYVNS